MSKWRVARVSKSVPRASTIMIGALVGIVTALALPYVHSGDPDCSLIRARLETSESPALELHFCATVPSTGGILVRYDVAVRVAIMPARAR
jgi:hypothetical protein